MAQSTFSMLDIDGNARNFSASISLMSIPQAGGDQQVFAYSDNIKGKTGDEVGILIGDGVGAVTAQSYYLGAEFSHGTGSGEIEYFGGLVNDVVVSGSDTYFDIERIFRNSSGGTIVVKEYGITVIAGGYATLIARDVYSDVGDWVTVTDGEYLKVTYRVKVTV